MSLLELPREVWQWISVIQKAQRRQAEAQERTACALERIADALEGSAAGNKPESEPEGEPTEGDYVIQPTSVNGLPGGSGAMYSVNIHDEQDLKGFGTWEEALAYARGEARHRQPHPAVWYLDKFGRYCPVSLKPNLGL